MYHLSTHCSPCVTRVCSTCTCCVHYIYTTCTVILTSSCYNEAVICILYASESVTSNIVILTVSINNVEIICILHYVYSRSCVPVLSNVIQANTISFRSRIAKRICDFGSMPDLSQRQPDGQLLFSLAISLPSPCLCSSSSVSSVSFCRTL